MLLVLFRCCRLRLYSIAADDGNAPAGWHPYGMSLVLEPDVDEPGTPTAADGGDEGGKGEPWWHPRQRVVILAVALLFLGAAVGYAVTSWSAAATPSAGSVDVGFLQDMRWHHDQGVKMALLQLAKPTTEQDPRVRSIANDIVLTQQFENGVMAGQLRSWGQAEANESGTGMAWMGMSVPIDRMLGMASEAEIEQLKATSGPAADLLFLQLMAAHHAGGLHMAVDASARGGTDVVRSLSGSILSSQQFELAEIRNLQQALTNA